MVRISNCGKSENGGIYGVAGDSTGQEYWNINYWSNGWQYVFSYPSASIASRIALYAQHAAENDNIGYSWSGRETMWQQISFLNSATRDSKSGGIHDPMNIKAKCNADCSSSTMAIIRAVGLDANNAQLSTADTSLNTTGMINGGLERIGFQRKRFSSESQLKTGDILMTDGHACVVICGNDSGIGNITPTENPQTQQQNSLIPNDSIGIGTAALQGMCIYAGIDIGTFRDKVGHWSGVDGDSGSATSKTACGVSQLVSQGKIKKDVVDYLLALNK